MTSSGSKTRKPRHPAKESKPTRHNRPKSKLLGLAMAISHPLRYRIITAMTSPDRNASPKQLSEQFDLDVKRVAYHMRELAALGYVELIDTQGAPRGDR